MTLENVNMAEGAGKMPPIAVGERRAPNADAGGEKYIDILQPAGERCGRDPCAGGRAADGKAQGKLTGGN